MMPSEQGAGMTNAESLMMAEILWLGDRLCKSFWMFGASASKASDMACLIAKVIRFGVPFILPPVFGFPCSNGILLNSILSSQGLHDVLNYEI